MYAHTLEAADACGWMDWDEIDEDVAMELRGQLDERAISAMSELELADL